MHVHHPHVMLLHLTPLDPLKKLFDSHEPDVPRARGGAAKERAYGRAYVYYNTDVPSKFPHQFTPFTG